MLSSNVYPVGPNTVPFYRPYANCEVQNSPPPIVGGSSHSDDATIAMDTTSECEVVNESLSCHHCEFRCHSANEMTQHRWAVHPLLMKKKKHLMAPSRKRQMSENLGVKIRDVESEEEPRLKRAASTGSKDSNDSSSDERMSPHEFSVLPKTKSSSVGDIPSMQQDCNTPEEQHRKESATVNELAVAPFVALYGQQIVNSIATSMLRPASVVTPCAEKPLLVSETQPVGKSTVVPNATPWPVRRFANPSLHSSYVSGDNHSQAFVSASVAANAVNREFNIASHLPCIVPYHVPTLLPYSHLTNHSSIQGHMQQRSAPEIVAKKTDRMPGQIPCTVATPQYTNSLSALSSVASSILANEMKPSPHVITTLMPKTSGTDSPRPQTPRQASEAPQYHGMQQQLPPSRTPVQLASAIQRKPDSREELRMRSGRAAVPKQWRTMEAETLRHAAAAKRAEDERMRSLEDALRKSDCCDISMYSSWMPIRCPDGTWKTVLAKRIAGAWLVQGPDKVTTSVVFPNSEAKVTPEARMPSVPGDVCKRLLTNGSKHCSALPSESSLAPGGGAIMSLLLKS